MVRGLRTASVAAALVLLVSSSSSAQTTEAADRAFREGQIDVAAERYEVALQSGDLRGPELVRAYLRRGMLATWLGDALVAERHLLRALSLDPDLETPGEFDPESQARFEALRARASGLRPSVSAERVGATTVAIRAEGGAAFDAVIRVLDRDDAVVERPFRARVEVEGVAGGASVQLVDEWGNELASTSVPTTSPEEPLVTDETPVEADTDGPSRAGPWVLGISGGAVVVVGATLVALGRRDVAAVEGAPDGSMYADFRDRAERAGWVTGLGVGALALGAATVALSLWLARRDDSPEIELAIGLSGAMVRGRF